MFSTQYRHTKVVSYSIRKERRGANERSKNASKGAF